MPAYDGWCVGYDGGSGAAVVISEGGRGLVVTSTRKSRSEMPHSSGVVSSGSSRPALRAIAGAQRSSELGGWGRGEGSGAQERTI